MKLSQIVKDVKSAREFINENQVDPEYFVALFRYYIPKSFFSLSELEIGIYQTEDFKDLKEIIIVWEEGNRQ